MRVMQIEPGPTPTLTAFAPASMRSCVPSAVATLPAMMSTSPKACRSPLTASMALSEWPCADVNDDHIGTRLQQQRGPVKEARTYAHGGADAQTPLPIFVASGCCDKRIMSLLVISPASRPSPSTSGSFSMRCCGGYRRRPAY